MADREEPGVAGRDSGEVRKRIQALTEVSALPITLEKIIGALNRRDVTIQEIEDLIQHDQSLAARIVSVANSAYYFGHRAVHVNSLDQAILVLGFEDVKRIALGISIFKMLPLPYPTMKKMWAHAYRVALAAGFFATRIPESDKGVAFLGGLLHDIGRVALISTGGDRDMSGFAGARGAEIIRLEEALFGCSHAEAGHWFLEGLSLPRELVMPVCHHHVGPGYSEHPLIVTPVFIAEGFVSTLPEDETADGEWSEEIGTLALACGIDARVLDECRGLLVLEDEFLRGFFAY